MITSEMREKAGAEPVALVPGVPQFFLDDVIIAHQHKLVRRWLPAKIYPKPVIEPDRPWEQRTLTMFGTVFPQPGGGFRIYYSEWGGSHQISKTYLAESEDGFRWNKPELGVVEWRGSSANNITLACDQYNDGPSIVRDMNDPEHPYKLLTFQVDSLANGWGEHWGLYGYQSRDGLRWEKIGDGILVRAGDRTNLMATKPDGKYVAYTRHPRMWDEVGARAIYRIESDDFLNWTEPELVLAADLADEPDVEYYGMSVFERHGWFFGLLEYWRNSIDTIEVHLVYSRDGKSWQRPAERKPFIAPIYDWNRTWNSCASNGPIIVNEQMVFYFGGRWVSHHYDSAQQYGAIGYASLPLDRFCAIEGASGGVLETVPILWPGGELVVNADARESFTSHPGACDGEVAVEVLDAEGKPIPGLSGDDRGTFRWNTHMRCAIQPGDVKWSEGRGMNGLKGKVVRLRFHLRHARLFTFTATGG